MWPLRRKQRYLHGDGSNPVGLGECVDVVLDVPVEESPRAASLDLGVDAAHRRHRGHEGHRDAEVGRLLVKGRCQVDGAGIVDAADTGWPNFYEYPM